MVTVRVKERAAQLTALARDSAASSRPLYLVFYAVSMLGTGLVLPVTSLNLTERLGLDPLQVSSCFLVLGLAGLAVGPMAGYAVDRYPVAALAALGVAVQGLGFVLLAAFVGYLPTLWGLGVVGLGNGIRFSAGTALLVQLFGRDRVKKMAGIQFTLMTGGMAIGAFASTEIVKAMASAGYRLIFALNAVTFFLYAACVIVTGWPLRKAMRGDRPLPLRAIIRPWTDRGFRRILAFNLLITTFAFAQFSSTVPVALRDSGKVGIVLIGLLFSGYAVGTFGLQPLVAKVIRRMSLPSKLSAAAMLWAGSFGVAAFLVLSRTSGPGQVTMLLLFALLCSFAQSLLGRSFPPMTAAAAPPALIGVYSAAMALAGAIATMVGPGLGFLLMELLGPGAFLAVMLCACLAAAVTVPRGLLRVADPDGS
jgi:MFS family permease